MTKELYKIYATMHLFTINELKVHQYKGVSTYFATPTFLNYFLRFVFFILSIGFYKKLLKFLFGYQSYFYNAFTKKVVFFTAVIATVSNNKKLIKYKFLTSAIKNK